MCRTAPFDIVHFTYSFVQCLFQPFVVLTFGKTTPLYIAKEDKPI